jgi:MFS family permease
MGQMRTIRKNNTSLFLFLSSQVIYRTAIYATIPIFPLFIRDLGFAITELGIITASLGVALVIFEPLWGSLLNRLGARNVFISSLLMMVLVLFSYTLARDLTVFIFVHFLSGLFGSAIAVSTRALMSGAIPRKESAFGTWWAIYAAGGVIGPIIGGIIATQGYILVFYVATLIAAIGFFMSFAAPRLEKTNQAASFSRFQDMDGHEKRILLIASSLIILPYFLRAVYMTYVPVFAKESPKFLLDSIEIGEAISTIGVIGFFAPFAFNRFAQKKGTTRTIILGMVLQATAFVMLPVISGFPLLFSTAAIFGLGEAATNPCMLAFMAGKIRSSNQGLAIGVYGAGEDIGALIGPVVIGNLYQNFTAEFSFCVTAMIMIVNTILAASLLRRATRKQSIS